MKRKPHSYQLYAATTVFFWSIAYVFTRLALQYVSPLSLSFLRYAVAGVLLLLFALATKMKPPAAKDLPWFLLSGVAGFFLYVIVFNIGTSTVSAATSSVVIATVPVFTALGAAVLFREKLKGHQWVAIGVEFSGILVLTLYHGVFTVNVGVLWLLLAAVLLSVYNLVQRRLTRTYTALQATTYSIFIGALGLCVFAPMAVREAAGLPLNIALYILAMGVFSSAVAYVAWSKAFERAEKTSSVSNYMFFTPFLTSLLALLIAKEVPGPETLLGGGIIVAGALLFNKNNLLRRGK